MSSFLSPCSSSLSPPSAPRILDSASQSGQFCTHTHPEGHLPTSGGIFGCHGGRWGRATGIWELETKDTTIDRPLPTPVPARSYSAPEVNGADGEKFCPTLALLPASAQPAATGPLVSSPLFSIREAPTFLCVPFGILCKF